MTNLKISRSPSLSVALLAAGLLVACGIEPDEIDAADTAEEQAADEDGSGTGEGDNEGVGDGDGDNTGDGDGDGDGDSGDGDGDSGDGDGDPTGDGDGDPTGDGDGDGDTGDGDGDGDGDTGDGDGDGDLVCGDLECNACYQCARDDDQNACADEKAACAADPGCVAVSECQYWCGAPTDPEFEGCMEFCAEGKPGGELFEDLVECLACDVCTCPGYFQCE